MYEYRVRVWERKGITSTRLFTRFCYGRKTAKACALAYRRLYPAHFAVTITTVRVG